MKPLPTQKVGKPTPEKRSEIIQAHVREIVESLPSREKRLFNSMQRHRHLFEEQKLLGISAVCNQRYREQMNLAVGAYMQGNRETGDKFIREAVANMYWSCELNQQESIVQHIGYDAPDSDYKHRLILHGLACACGAPHIADWLAPYLLNVLHSGDGAGRNYDLVVDVPFRGFYNVVIKAHVTGVWPEKLDPIPLRAYGDLLMAAGNPEAFRDALVAWCDYRLAQSLGFDGMEATKRRTQDQTGSVLDGGGWRALLPFELFSLKYVFERTTGKTLSLEADHPLLHVPQMKLPQVLPLYEDDYLRQAIELAEKVYGPGWKKLTPVEVLN